MWFVSRLLQLAQWHCGQAVCLEVGPVHGSWKGSSGFVMLDYVEQAEGIIYTIIIVQLKF